MFQVSARPVATASRGLALLGGAAATLLLTAVLAAPAGASPTPSSGATTSSSTSSTSGNSGTSGTSTTSTTSGSTTTAPSSASTSAPASTTTSTTSAASPVPHVTAPAPPTSAGPPCVGYENAQTPVLCLPNAPGFPKDLGEDQPATLARGDDIYFAAQLVNHGPAVSDASIVITLPAGLQLYDDDSDGQAVTRIDDWYENDNIDGDGTPLTCVAAPGGSPITCQTGPLATGANLVIAVDVEVADDAAVGANLPFTVALQPVAPDTYPATSVTASIDVAGAAHLVVTVDPKAARIVVAQHVTLVVTVHNAGPSAAPNTIGFGIAADKNTGRAHFTITNGTSLAKLGSIAGGVRIASLDRSQRALANSLAHERIGLRSAAAAGVPTPKFWQIGTLAPGATVKIRVDLRADTPGSDLFVFAAFSDASDPSCDDDEGGGSSSSGSSSAPASEPASSSSSGSSSASASTSDPDETPSVTFARQPAIDVPPGCDSLAVAHLTAVKAPAGTDSLANSGVQDVGRQVTLGLLALALGCGLAYAGRRRFGAPRHG